MYTSTTQSYSLLKSKFQFRIRSLLNLFQTESPTFENNTIKAEDMREDEKNNKIY